MNRDTKVWLSYFLFSIRFLSHTTIHWNHIAPENYVKLTEPPSWFVAYTLYLFNLLIRFISTHSLTWHRFHPVDERQCLYPIHRTLYSRVETDEDVYRWPYIQFCRRRHCQRFFLSHNLLRTYAYHFESFISELSSSIPIRPNRWALTFDIYGLIQVHGMINSIEKV